MLSCFILLSMFILQFANACFVGERQVPELKRGSPFGAGAERYRFYATTEVYDRGNSGNNRDGCETSTDQLGLGRHVGLQPSLCLMELVGPMCTGWFPEDCVYAVQFTMFLSVLCARKTCYLFSAVQTFSVFS